MELIGYDFVDPGIFKVVKYNYMDRQGVQRASMNVDRGDHALRVALVGAQ